MLNSFTYSFFFTNEARKNYQKFDSSLNPYLVKNNPIRKTGINYQKIN